MNPVKNSRFSREVPREMTTHIVSTSLPPPPPMATFPRADKIHYYICPSIYMYSATGALLESSTSKRQTYPSDIVLY